MTSSNHPNGLTFNVLSVPDIERIYQASLECLERTGVKLLNAEARSLLAAAGARLEADRVRIPAHIIQNALQATPPGFRLWGRDPERCIEVRPGEVHFGPGLTSSYFIDPETGERRRSRRADVGLAARVCDALVNIDYVMGLALPEDVPPERASVFEFAEMVMNTGKPLVAWGYSVDNLQEIFKIATAAVGGEAALLARPLFAVFALGLGPLVLPGSVMENVLWAADRGLPIVYHGPGVAGVSAPLTGAGTLVINLAGSLAGLSVIQLKRPGTPVCIGAVPSPMDPRSGRPSFGAPELSLFSAALAEIARYLHLPMMGTAGASEAKTLDLQAAIESTVQVVFSLLSGASLPHDAGFLDCADIGSLEMLVMNDEIISLNRRIMRGIPVNETTLNLDLIDQVGPGGEYISRMETARQLRHELWLPRLMDRQPWHQWTSKGSTTMQDRIRLRLRQILDTHQPSPLPDGADQDISTILAGTKNYPT